MGTHFLTLALVCASAALLVGCVGTGTGRDVVPMGPARVLWQEGEDFATAPTGLGPVTDDRAPASGGKILYGPALAATGRTVTYELGIPVDVPDAQIILRYARLHWRDTMVPAVVEVKMTGPDAPPAREISLDNTGGWGRSPSDWGVAGVALGDLKAGRWTVTLTGKAEGNDINMDGFFIAPGDFKMTAEELAALSGVQVTSQGYCGLRHPSRTLRQDPGALVAVAVRSFAGEPDWPKVALADSAGRAGELAPEGTIALDPAGSKAFAYALPADMPDGQYEILISGQTPPQDLVVPVAFVGRLIADLEGAAQDSAAFAAELKGADSPAAGVCLADFEHMAEYFKARHGELTESSPAPESAFRKGLAEHEGIINPTPLVSGVRKALAQAREMMDNLRAGKPPYADRFGDLRRAFRSDAGGSPQVYRSFVPRAYATKARVPLILFLHGGGGDEDYWPDMGNGALLEMLDERGYFALMPRWHSRTNPNWQEDMLQLIDLTLEQYPRIDPTRIYCTGVSMGGFGTYGLATESPDRFAGICCVSGTGRAERAERLAGVPTLILQGGADSVVPPAGAIKVAEAMEKLGYTVDLRVFPTYGHDYRGVEYLSQTLDFWERHPRRR